MASFCKQCSQELFGEDFRDFAGVTTPEHMERELAMVVLCEECGAIQVDPDGSCISQDCLLRGHNSTSRSLLN